MKKVLGIITILLLAPIRFYLMWYLLKSVNATELPIFLFWVSVPLGLLLHIISEILKKD